MKALTFKDVVFDINNMAYNKLNRSLKINWARHSQINQYPQLQFAGIESESITINGVIFFKYQKSIDALKRLNHLAKLGEAHFLIGLDGMIYGRWVLESITENIISDSQIDYSLSLVSYESKSDTVKAN